MGALILLSALLILTGQLAAELFCPEKCQCSSTKESLPVGNVITDCSHQSLLQIKNFTVDGRTKKLDLSFNQLTCLDNSSFNSEVTNLVSLDLSNNLIEVINDQPFSHFASSLRLINLTDNRLVQLPTAALQQTTGLNQLFVSSNRISTIPTRAFETLKRLQFLKLDNNRITTIESEAFVGLSQLTSIDLSNNLIVATPQKVFKKMAQQKTIKFIDLTFNNWSCGCFLKWPRQLVLDIILSLERENRIPFCTYEGSQLKWTDERIQIITEKECCPGECRCDANKFTVNCSDSSLDHLPSDIDEATRELSLANNRIQKIDSRWWIDLKLYQLQVLDLSRNQITVIQTEAFANLTKLERLILSNNSIVTVESGAFKGLSELKQLDLMNNLLEQLPDGFIGDVNYKIVANNKSGLLLANNPWNCNCNLTAIIKFVVASTPVNGIWPKCAQPDILKGKEWSRNVTQFIDCDDKKQVTETPKPTTTSTSAPDEEIYWLVYSNIAGVVCIIVFTVILIGCLIYGFRYQLPVQENIQLDRLNPVPLFVKRCVELIESEHMDTEGIYRVPASKGRVDWLMRKYRKNHNVNVEKLAPELDAFEVSSGLKLFLVEERKPLTPEEASRFIALAARDATNRLAELREFFQSLSPNNFQLNKYLFEHLLKVAGRSSHNLMDSLNLARVWWFTLTRYQSNDQALYEQQTNLIINIVRFVIDNFNDIFNGQQEEEEGEAGGTEAEGKEGEEAGGTEAEGKEGEEAEGTEAEGKEGEEAGGTEAEGKEGE